MFLIVFWGMNIDGKTKDTYKTRLDLKEMGIRRELHPICVNGRTKLPPACYSLSSTEKKGVMPIFTFDETSGWHGIKYISLCKH